MQTVLIKAGYKVVTEVVPCNCFTIGVRIGCAFRKLVLNACPCQSRCALEVDHINNTRFIEVSNSKGHGLIKFPRVFISSVAGTAMG